MKDISKIKNVWLRRHFQRKFNQRFKWLDEMNQNGGEPPQAWLDEMENAARLNAGHEPDDDLSFPNHSR